MRRPILRVDLPEPRPDQPVARHRHQDARLSELEDEENGGHREDRAGREDPRRPVLLHEGERRGERVGHAHELVVRDHPAEDEGRRDVENGADRQRSEDAARHVASGVLALLRRRRDRVEPDIGEEHERGTHPDAREASREKRRPVRRLHEEGADGDEEEERRNFQDDDEVVDPGRLLDPPHEEDRDRRRDKGRKEIEDDRDPEELQVVQVGLVRDRLLGRENPDASFRHRPGREEGGAVVGREEGGELEPEPEKELAEVGGPRDRHGDVSDRVLEDQVPPDDPRDELAERGVAVGVRRPGHRDEARELRIAETAEAACERRQKDRDDDPGARGGQRAAARGGRPERREDPGTDDRADSQGHQVGGRQLALEPGPFVTSLGDELVDRLRSEETHG